MEQEPTLNSMDLAFAENDMAHETKRAVEYLHRQVDAMLKVGCLESEEAMLAQQALKNLEGIQSKLDDRHERERLQRADWDSIEGDLATIHDLSLDIRRKLDDVSDIDENTDDPHPNIHAQADETHSMASAALEGLESMEDN